jgi:two-component system chemotaxis sensor kinase CheA
MDNLSEEDQETIREFLVECDENLSQLDQDLVKLEKHPTDAALLGSIFRTIHTIKGTCGFLAFTTLESITHQAESVLSQLRDGKRELTPELVSLILETVDATRKVLASIEATGKEGDLRFEDLTARLRASAEACATPENKPVSIQPPSIPPAPVQPAPSKPVPTQATEVASPVPQTEHPADKSGSTRAAKKLPQKAAKVEDTKVEDTKGEDTKVGDNRRSGQDRRKEDGRREEDADRHSAVVDANIRVGVDLLDKLMDLVGELVLTRNQILQFNMEREDATLNATSQRLNLLTTELQESVMKTRMQPIGVVWSKFPRVVRDMSVSLGKQIELVMDGAETELDRTIIESIRDPLMHIVRNSCDHGLELPDDRVSAGKPPRGKLTLRAFHEGGQVNIEISDDGAGIDVARVKQKAVEKGLLRAEQASKLSEREAMNLIFLPGFSTSQTVTNISGRGVGMDVVKSHVEKIGGVVDVFSQAGEGSTVKIKIPLTLAIIPGLVVTSGGQRFVIPQVSLLELIRVEGGASEKRIEHVHGTPVYRRRGSLLPVAYLNQVLGLRSENRDEAVNMVVLQAEDRQFGIVVDGINDTQEIVVKPLGKQLKGLTWYAGATTMGDGCVALILDVHGIGERAGVFGGAHEQAHAAEEKAAKKHGQKVQAEIERQRLLLFRSGSFNRLAIPLSLVARLEEFPRSVVEHASGGQVIQYRDQILSLVSLRDVLEPGSADLGQPSDLVQVVVFNEGGHSVGMIVDEIVDVAEEAVKIRKKSDRKGILGSVVVGKRVTDFLDLNEVIRCSQNAWEQSTERDAGGKSVLVADASVFSRGMIRSGLDMAGYVVFEAANLDEAMHRLERQPVDVVVAALDLPPEGCSALLASMRSRPEWENIPVLALAATARQAKSRAVRTAGFEDCQVKSDRAQVLESVARLTSLLPDDEAILACAGEEK